MAAVLRVTLLGDFALARNARPIPGFGSARGRSLLAYLILRRQAPQPRDRLAYLLWPDSSESQARTNLRRELHHLRKALPEADRHLHVDTTTLQWRPDAPARVDVVDFEAAVARADEAGAREDLEEERGHLADAVAAYGGELLPGCYERWIEPERDRLRRECRRTLERLARRCEEAGDLRSAIRCAERLVHHDPLREASYARLIDLHGAAGDRAAALDVFRTCAEVLEREFEVEPGPATVEARERAMAGGRTVRERDEGEERRAVVRPSRAERRLRGEGPRTEPPLVGRERELGVLRDWVRRSAEPDAGDGQVLLLLGEPGIGKTRLLDELATEVWSGDGRVLRGRGFEAETVRPYGAWTDALRSAPRDWLDDAGELGALLPGVGGAGVPAADRNRLFDAVARWLSGLADDGAPLAVLVDDVQWLDEASVALLHYVIRVLADAPVLVACAARPGELDERAPVSRLVRSLERTGRARTLRLGPMSRDDILALARVHRRGLDADRIFADSGGNPLFALELARASADEDADPRPDEGADGSSGEPADGTADLEELIRERFARLGASAREVLRWAAALGRSFDPATIALLVDRPLPALLPALDQLEHHNILRPGERGGDGGGAPYDFAHDIVRRVAYETLSGPRRRLVHLHIARVLDGADGPEGVLAGEVAHHAALGGDDALAARASVTAGERCLRIFAHAEAAEVARRGLQRARALEGRERVRLQMSLLRVAVGAGLPRERTAELDEELRALTAEARSLGMIEVEAVGHSLRSVLGYGNEAFGRVRETSIRAAETVRDAEEDPASDPGVRARALGQAGACLASIQRDVERAETLLREAGALAERAGIEVADVPMGLGAVRYFRAEHDEAVRYLERAFRMARREQDHFRECECLRLLVMLELDSGAPAKALERCRELTPVASKMEGGSEAPLARGLEAVAAYALGEEGVGEREDVGERLDETLRDLRRLDASRKLAYVQSVAAEADLAAARPRLALDRSDEAVRAARTADHRSGIARAGALRVRSLQALGEDDRAREALDALRREVGDGAGLSARARRSLDALEKDPSLVV